MRLYKVLHGRWQASRPWNEVLCKLVAVLVSSRAAYDESLHTRLSKNGSRAIIVAYVNDMRIVG